MLRTFHAQLAAWYRTHGRHHLPWRQTDDPYPIWVSEVMLQQTQVATVLERFYHPFLLKFPTVQALAAAPREAVMKAWEGLGYYRRAGFLHEAAKRAHNGLPRDIEGLRALPGIGRNTAHAVAAFAYRAPVAIMEANVKRIVARIFAWENPSENDLWAGAEALLNQREAFDYNQAMMDIGSLVCLPKTPHCSVCPANKICEGQTHPQAYPAPKIKKAVPVRAVRMLVLEDAAGKFYLETRDAALLGGLSGFVQVPDGESIAPRLAAIVSPASDVFETLGNVTHIYSHFRCEGEVLYQKIPRVMQGPQWHSRRAIAELALSKIDHKVLALVDKCHSGEKKAPKARMPRAKH